MITKTFSATRDGIDGAIVQVEAVRLNSLPQITVTGLPGEVVKESRERVRACLVNLGFDVPTGKVIVHLSPANIKKQGGHYDLAIAVSILCAETKLAEPKIHEVGFIGELSLNGQLCPIKGILPLIDVLNRDHQIKKIIIPKQNEVEGGFLSSDKILVASDLGEVLDFLRGQKKLESCSRSPVEYRSSEQNVFDQIRDQNLAKRAIQISMAGRHHILLVGPPGVGKSMLSVAASDLLPPICHEEFIEILKIHSAVACSSEDFILSRRRPFRSPHHTISANALLGGGTGIVVPGEISLAHRGVLFLDEFPEYRRDALEGLREPLQSGRVYLNRINGNLELPAQFTMIAAMNPCPCGMYSSLNNSCRCSPEKKRAYQKKLSSPILDRIAIMVQMNQVSLEDSHSEDTPPFDRVKESILRTFEIQERRFKKLGINREEEINFQHPDFRLDEASEISLKSWQKQGRLSHRRANQIIKVARTIADLDGEDKIKVSSLREAWSLRCFDFYYGS